MKTSIAIALLSLPLALGLGCATAPETTDESASAPAGQAPSDIDATELTALDAAAAPRSFKASIYSLDVIARGLVGTTEELVPMSEEAGRVTYQSASWSVERTDDGQVLALRTTEPGAPAPQDEARLQEASLGRLAGFGIPREEMGVVLQRKQMMQSREKGVIAAPELGRYKTFVYRTMNGVRVRGHRAVVSYDADGSFARALVRWPALAATGHLMGTKLTREEVLTRLDEAVAKEGVAPTRMLVRWTYVPTAAPGGTVTLRLMAEARAETMSEDGISEPRVIDVEVDAVP